jgi:hypothetical protein
MAWGTSRLALTRLVHPAPFAYRADFAGINRSDEPAADSWIAVASVFEHAALATPRARAALTRKGKRIAAAAVGRRAVREFMHREWPSPGDLSVAAVVLLAEQMVVGGAMNLAATTLSSLAGADSSITALDRARVTARRARIDWMMGKIDEARESYRRLEGLGRRTKIAEISVRALVGRVALAQLKGNYPEMDRYASRAVRLAERASLRRLSWQARDGLMIAASYQQRFNDALVHGWAVYSEARGNAVDEAQIVQNLGEVFARAGHAAVARAAFAAVVSRELPARITLPALGGLALASAATGDRPTVEWAAAQVTRLGRAKAPRYAFASALLECANALVQLKATNQAEQMRRAALRVGLLYNFYEISYKAEGLQTDATRLDSPTPAVLDDRATRIGREVAGLEPRRLPRYVDVTLASV